MALAPGMSQMIEGWLRAFLALPDGDIRRPFALRFNALPLYADMGGCILLRPTGEFICVEWDKEAEGSNEPDLNWQSAAIRSASRRYPEILSLLPTRPPDANECRACSGSGFVALSSEVTDVGCGQCWGRGWV